MRIRGGLFTRAPECRLNGLEMDLSQIRAVARGSSKREQLEVAGKGRRVFDEEQMQIEVDFYFVSGEILMMSC